MVEVMSVRIERYPTGAPSEPYIGEMVASTQ